MIDRLSSRTRDERGVTLVLFALLMVLLLVGAGLVVNIGLVRSDRQRNKSAADVAVAAGLRALNFNGYVAPFRGACATLDYLKANHAELAGLSLTSGWTNGTPATIAGNPCDALDPAYATYQNTTCNNSPAYVQPATARSTFAWFSGTTGNVDVVVKAGYAASDMTADGFADETYHSDRGVGSQYGCDQLAVIVTEREDAGFGRVIGANELSSSIRSVGRVDIATDTEVAIGLLLLERNDCATVDIGGNDSYVQVLGAGQNPGIVHSDSAGTSGAAGNCNSKAVLNGLHTGPPIAATSSEAPGVMAHRAPVAPNAPGVVSTVATSNAIDNPTYVVAEGGTASIGDLQGRYLVDKQYRPALDDLRTTAYAQTGWTTSNVPTASGWRITGCSPDAASLAWTEKLFVDCADFSSTATFEASHIVFRGSITLGGGGTPTVLRMPNARDVYVYGKTSGGNPPSAVGVNGILEVNANTAGADCPESVTSPAELTRFVIVNGAVTTGAGGTIRMCQTFLYLAQGTLPASTAYPGPAPYSNTWSGVVRTQSGSRLDWTAPNLYSTKPTTAQWVISPFEDLALWTESSAAGGSESNSFQIAGGGGLRLSGVFFAPNANAFNITGGSGANITHDAQFIVRKLNVTGGGVLKMRANPENSIQFPYFKGYSLVR